MYRGTRIQDQIGIPRRPETSTRDMLRAGCHKAACPGQTRAQICQHLRSAKVCAGFAAGGLQGGLWAGR